MPRRAVNRLLSSARPDDERLQLELLTAFYKIGEIDMKLGRPGDALAAFRRAESTLKDLDAKGALSEEQKPWFQKIRRQIGRVEKILAPKAADSE